MSTSRMILAVVVIVIVIAAGFWGYTNYLAPQAVEAESTAVPENAEEDTPAQVVSAEGQVVPAEDVTLAFTQAGRVAEVLAVEGQAVEEGEILARLEDRALQAALEQAEAGLAAAQANQEAAGIRLEQAQVAAQAGEGPGRINAWSTPMPPQVDQAGWYFDKEQEIAAAQAEVEAARFGLEAEEENLEDILGGAASGELLTAEERIANARAAFLVADELLERARRNSDRELQDEAQRRYDIALSELESAQDNYTDILSTEEAEDVMTARARTAVARERYETALDRLNALQTGNESLDIQAAQAAYEQAGAAVSEAEAAVKAAQQALEQATLEAPFAGVVAAVDAGVGEVVAPGKGILVLATLSEWQVKTTDLAEIDVALVQVGQPAEITLDAFPDLTFQGTVSRIALVSEDSRGSVTYSVWLTFEPDKVPVRWGMTAFVNIDVR